MDELSYCLQLACVDQSLAARFAAKEAASKAFGTGIGGEFGWHTASIRKKQSGAPELILDSVGQQLLSSRGGKRAWVSLSHTNTLAMATVILEA